MPAPTLPTVLVVDDELRSQEALRRTLDEEFEVFTASSELARQAERLSGEVQKFLHTVRAA